MTIFDKNLFLEPLSFRIFTSVAKLPSDWDAIADSNIFLTANYLKVLENAAPLNMTCFFIALFDQKNLIGIALAQFLDLSKVESFGDRDSCLKTKVRHLVFRNFSSKVLFVGNNMLTGQNAFSFCDSLSMADGLHLLQKAVMQIKEELKPKHGKVHIEVWKDFSQETTLAFDSTDFKPYFKFSTQPNMVFDIRADWFSFDHYIDALHKKYRDQYKRARKKAEGIEKRKMDLDEIAHYSERIHELYLTVAENAPFNTFYLPKGHFYEFKKQLKDQFLFYGYFENGQLVGFNTLIKNGRDIDTYFLGYSENCQREKMLYLNMLYDMIAYSINKGYKRIIFARTALEIKSSVGALPVETFGFIRHNNTLINKKMDKLFRFFEPEMQWQQRHPFKE